MAAVAMQLDGGAQSDAVAYVTRRTLRLFDPPPASDAPPAPDAPLAPHTPVSGLAMNSATAVRMRGAAARADATAATAAAGKNRPSVVIPGATAAMALTQTAPTSPEVVAPRTRPKETSPRTVSESAARKAKERRAFVTPRGAVATHMCLWERLWYPVSIVRRFPDRWRVHYSGFSESSDEWVAVKGGRLRPITTLASSQLETARALEAALPPLQDPTPLSPATVASVVRTATDRIHALTLRLVWVPVRLPLASTTDPPRWQDLVVQSDVDLDANVAAQLWWPGVATGHSTPSGVRGRPRRHAVVPVDPAWTVADACAAVASMAAAANVPLQWSVGRAVLRLFTVAATSDPPTPAAEGLPLTLPLGTPEVLLSHPADIPTVSTAAVAPALDHLAAAPEARAWVDLWQRAVDLASSMYLTACLAGRVAHINSITVREDGRGLNAAAVAAAGELRPAIICDPAGLAMQIPNADWLTYRRIAELLGPDFKVPVIDVDAQRETEEDWPLSQVARYFEGAAPPSEPAAVPPVGLRRRRQRTLNILSLEISQTELAKAIVPPTLVRELDWTELVWPASLKPDAYPRVQLYCLMSAEGSFTDFHIDFGGSSVFYHVVKGEKVFYFAPPTPENLRLYEAWTLAGVTSEGPPPPPGAFFELIAPNERYMARIKAGQSLVLPGGWLHAVSTPRDSVVIGGNFLHSFNLTMQLKIHQLEQRAAVVPRFQYPYFTTINWFALDWYLRRIRFADGEGFASTASYPEAGDGVTPPSSMDALWPAWCSTIWPAERAGLEALHGFLHQQLRLAARDILADAHTSLDLPFSLEGAHARLRELEAYLAR